MPPHGIKVDNHGTLLRQDKICCLHITVTDTGKCQLRQQTGYLLPGSLDTGLVQ